MGNKFMKKILIYISEFTFQMLNWGNGEISIKKFSIKLLCQQFDTHLGLH